MVLVRAQAPNYRDQLNVLLGDAQSRGEYLGGYRIRVVENGHSLHVGDTDSDQEHGSSTPYPQNDGDIVEIPPLSSASQLFSVPPFLSDFCLFFQ